MTTSQRLLQQLHVGDTWLWDEGKIVKRFGEHSMLGHDLAERLANAREYHAKLTACIESMAHVLDEGETVQERKARIEAEDADPSVPAKAAGWFAIEDFAALCDAGPNGFRKRIEHCRGQIVKPHDEATFQRLVGTGWREYPERFEHWGDHFYFADNWKDALAKVRKERGHL